MTLFKEPKFLGFYYFSVNSAKNEITTLFWLSTGDNDFKLKEYVFFDILILLVCLCVSLTGC